MDRGTAATLQTAVVKLMPLTQAQARLWLASKEGKKLVVTFQYVGTEKLRAFHGNTPTPMIRVVAIDCGAYQDERMRKKPKRSRKSRG